MKAHLVRLTVLLALAGVGLFFWSGASRGMIWLYAVDHFSVYRREGIIKDADVERVIGDTHGDWIKAVDYLVQKPLLDTGHVTQLFSLGLLLLAVYSGSLAYLENRRGSRANAGPS